VFFVVFGISSGIKNAINKMVAITNELSQNSSSSSFISEIDINLWILIPVLIIMFNLKEIIYLCKTNEVNKLTTYLIPILASYLGSYFGINVSEIILKGVV
jgi:hypothetical protein